MNASKTKGTTLPTASSDKPTRDIRLTAPTAWGELTQPQLRYVLTLLTEGVEGDALKTFMLIRFNGIKVLGRRREGWKLAKGDTVFYASGALMASMLQTLKFIDSYEDMDVRLDDIHGLHAVNALLHGVPFIDYLKMEIAYQGFMHSKKEEPLRSLTRLLYRDGKGRTVDGTPYTKAEMLGAHLWFSHVKRVLAAEFPDFFRPATQGNAEDADIMEMTRAQLRALTDGDITKEEAVKKADTWSALAELNAKAKEAKTLRRKP